MWLLFTAIALSALLLASCNTPFNANTGKVAMERMEFEDFDEVEINDAFTVQIRQGNEYQVMLAVDEPSLPYLQVSQRGDTLEVGLRPRMAFFFWNSNSTLRAEITMPSLVGVIARDASNVVVSGFRTDYDASFEVRDASSLSGEIETGDTHLIATDGSSIELKGDHKDINIEASGASNIRLTGRGQNATIHATEASRVDLADFPVQDAKVVARAASSISVNVSGTLDAEVRAASSITYYGNPTLGDINAREGSSVNARAE